MTMSSSLKIGLGAGVAALAAAGIFAAFQASSQSPAELAQLSDEEKLEILNSGDEAAIIELMEAEDALAQANAKKKRLEAEQERAASDKRAKEFWDNYDVSEIDLTGFNFDFVELDFSDEQAREIVTIAPGILSFTRSNNVTYPPSEFPCGLGYNEAENFLETAPKLSLPFETLDLQRISRFIADRAALSSGDCSCATQDVPVMQAYKLAEKLSYFNKPGSFSNDNTAAFPDKDDERYAVNKLGNAFQFILRDEKRAFCGQE